MTELIKVLVVDDDQRYADNTVKLLEVNGIFADKVYSGEDALDEIHNRSYDVVLLDMRLPGMTGRTTLERFREMGIHAKVIVVTGHASVDDAAEFIRLGAFDYVLKPTTTGRLIGQVLKAADAKEQEDREGRAGGHEAPASGEERT